MVGERVQTRGIVFVNEMDEWSVVISGGRDVILTDWS